MAKRLSHQSTAVEDNSDELSFSCHAEVAPDDADPPPIRFAPHGVKRTKQQSKITASTGTVDHLTGTATATTASNATTVDHLTTQDGTQKVPPHRYRYHHHHHCRRTKIKEHSSSRSEDDKKSPVAASASTTVNVSPKRKRAFEGKGDEEQDETSGAPDHKRRRKNPASPVTAKAETPNRAKAFSAAPEPPIQCPLKDALENPPVKPLGDNCSESKSVIQILDKMTRSNVRETLEQLLDNIPVCNSQALNRFVDQVYEKATEEPASGGDTSMYAELCLEWSKHFARDKKNNFVQAMLDKCEDEFHQLFHSKQDTVTVPESNFYLKKRKLGHLLFLGELFKRGLLKEHVLHDCMEHMLHMGENDDIHERMDGDHELVCQFFTVVGEHLELVARDEKAMTRYFERIQPIRWKYSDLVALRQNGWKKVAVDDADSSLTTFTPAPNSTAPKIGLVKSLIHANQGQGGGSCQTKVAAVTGKFKSADVKTPWKDAPPQEGGQAKVVSATAHAVTKATPKLAHHPKHRRKHPIRRRAQAPTSGLVPHREMSWIIASCPKENPSAAISAADQDRATARPATATAANESGTPSLKLPASGTLVPPADQAVVDHNRKQGFGAYLQEGTLSMSDKRTPTAIATADASITSTPLPKDNPTNQDSVGDKLVRTFTDVTKDASLCDIRAKRTPATTATAAVSITPAPLKDVQDLSFASAKGTCTSTARVAAAFISPTPAKGESSRLKMSFPNQERGEKRRLRDEEATDATKKDASFGTDAPSKVEEPFPDPDAGPPYSSLYHDMLQDAVNYPHGQPYHLVDSRKDVPSSNDVIDLTADLSSEEEPLSQDFDAILNPIGNQYADALRDQDAPRDIDAIRGALFGTPDNDGDLKPAAVEEPIWGAKDNRAATLLATNLQMPGAALDSNDLHSNSNIPVAVQDGKTAAAAEDSNGNRETTNATSDLQSEKRTLLDSPTAEDASIGIHEPRHDWEISSGMTNLCLVAKDLLVPPEVETNVNANSNAADVNESLPTVNGNRTTEPLEITQETQSSACVHNVVAGAAAELMVKAQEAAQNEIVTPAAAVGTILLEESRIAIEAAQNAASGACTQYNVGGVIAAAASTVDDSSGENDDRSRSGENAVEATQQEESSNVDPDVCVPIKDSSPCVALSKEDGQEQEYLTMQERTSSESACTECLALVSVDNDAPKRRLFIQRLGSFLRMGGGLLFQILGHVFLLLTWLLCLAHVIGRRLECEEHVPSEPAMDCGLEACQVSVVHLLPFPVVLGWIMAQVRMFKHSHERDTRDIALGLFQAVLCFAVVSISIGLLAQSDDTVMTDMGNPRQCVNALRADTF